MTPAHNDSRKGIQAEKPLAPWERPGYFRLDCRPHRGELLRWLGFGSLLAASCLLPGASLVVALPGHPLYVVLSWDLRLAFLILVWAVATQILAGWVFLAARHDLLEMAAGRKDPAGEDLTRRGRSSAAVAFLVAAACAAVGLASMR